MPPPLLPTHARSKHKRRGSGGTLLKALLYLFIVLCVGVGLIAHFRGRWHSSGKGAEAVTRQQARSEVKGQNQDAASNPHGQQLKRQDAMRREEMQRAHDSHSARVNEHARADTVARVQQVVPINTEQHQQQQQPSHQAADVTQPQQQQHQLQPQHSPQQLEAMPSPRNSFFELSATDIDGNVVRFSQYAGKVVLVVNVASACGYTDQNYKGLQQLYLKHKERGLEILGFPCNQFGSQESGSEAEIKSFCTGRYHVTFPMFSKVEVNGPHTHPVYQFLKTQVPEEQGRGADLGWNFYKYLVDRHGQPVKRFQQDYNAAAVEAAVEELLGPAPEVHDADSPVAVHAQPDTTSGQARQLVTGSDDVKAPEIHTHSVPSPVGGMQPAGGGGDRAPDLARDFFALSATDIDGNLVNFSTYAGKVVLVVNVASACGYTDQNYKGLEKTYLKYKEHGLEILGFPCNQFGSQESGSEAEIKSFCTDHYHVTFPMFSKIEVNGPNTHPVYQFLKSQVPASEGRGSDIGWNFFKFLVNKHGQPVKRFDQSFNAPAIEHEIYDLLHEA